MKFFEVKDGALFFKRRQEIMEICPWGAGLRVRATQNRSFSDKDWALDVPAKADGKIELFDDREKWQYLRCCYRLWTYQFL